MRTAAWLGVLIATGTAGDLSLARAMRGVGAPAILGPSSILRTLVEGSRQPWLWVGLLLHAAAFGAFLILLSWADVSAVVPASSLGYVAGTAGARLALGERIDGSRWTGVCLIAAGVALVLAG